jgi:4-amino-4-deoxy-L-arabinose transferase-like glycosyltransferase
MISEPASLRLANILALLLVLFSIWMSALVSRTVFERLPHLEDEVAYLFQARIFARGELVIETPQPRRAYWQPFVVDFDETGNRFGKYTPGWPAMLAVGVLLGQSWVVNAFVAGSTVALVYRLGREIFNPETGVIAAALTAFCPMALLLNATLMGHTAALCFTTLFLYAYWRMERGRQPLRWALIAGAALGLVVVNRPLTAIGVAAPLVVWSNIRLIKSFFQMVERESRRFVMEHLRPLLVLGAVTLLISTAIPIFNYAATDDPTTNLYTLVWSYDQVGFGEGYGRHGHTLEKGIRQARFDLSLMAADLFGWQLGAITPELQQHLLIEGDYWPLIGLSWILLPFGLALGWKRRWTWLLAAIPLALVTVHLAYWIGSQRYSTRYYFEGLTSLSILTAVPIAWLANRWSRRAVFTLFTLVMVASLYGYSTPRISPLYRFNQIGQPQIEAVQARRDGEHSVLALVTGNDVRWRAFGSLMAVTSPYLDSDIVVAWDNLVPGVREQILARFPDRQVIEIDAAGNDATFRD